MSGGAWKLGQCVHTEGFSSSGPAPCMILVISRRFCEDPGEILLKRSFFWCLCESSCGRLFLEVLVSRSCKIRSSRFFMMILSDFLKGPGMKILLKAVKAIPRAKILWRSRWNAASGCQHDLGSLWEALEEVLVKSWRGRGCSCCQSLWLVVGKGEWRLLTYWPVIGPFAKPCLDNPLHRDEQVPHLLLCHSYCCLYLLH